MEFVSTDFREAGMFCGLGGGGGGGDGLDFVMGLPVLITGRGARGGFHVLALVALVRVGVLTSMV
jgi:hypothetical protein